MNLKHGSKTRSILKAITWRVISVLTTVIVTYIITHDIAVTLSIGLFDSIIKLVLFYIHERIYYKASKAIPEVVDSTITHCERAKGTENHI